MIMIDVRYGDCGESFVDGWEKGCFAVVELEDKGVSLSNFKLMMMVKFHSDE